MTTSSAALSPFGVRTSGFIAADLPEEARQLLETKGTVRRLRRGEEAQRRDMVPSFATWLQSGRLRCSGLQADGSEFHGGWIMEGELFGIQCVLLGTTSRFTMTVDTPSAVLLSFSREVLVEMVETMPDGGVAVAVGLSRRLRQQYDMIDVIGQRNISDKLRAVLLWWSTNHGIPARDGSVELWVGQTELAVGVGASRQRVHLELQNLRDQGTLELGYRKVILRPGFFKPLPSSAAEPRR